MQDSSDFTRTEYRRPGSGNCNVTGRACSDNAATRACCRQSGATRGARDQGGSVRGTATTIGSNDRIFARVVSQGRVIYEACIEGARSVEDVLRCVCRAVSSLGQGLMTLALRNSTQGWAINRHLRIGAPRRGMAEGTQLTFAF